jgi:hypothetical protein
VSTGKPNPPCSISLQRRDPNGWLFQYQLGYYNTSCLPPQEDAAYITEILVQHNQNQNLCTCYKQTRYPYLNFDTTEKELYILATYEKILSFRVALSVSGVLSDFLPFVNQTTDSCEVPLVIDSKSCLLAGWLAGIS